MRWRRMWLVGRWLAVGACGRDHGHVYLGDDGESEACGPDEWRCLGTCVDRNTRGYATTRVDYVTLDGEQYSETYLGACANESPCDPRPERVEHPTLGEIMYVDVQLDRATELGAWMQFRNAPTVQAGVPDQTGIGLYGDFVIVHTLDAQGYLQFRESTIGPVIDAEVSGELAQYEGAPNGTVASAHFETEFCVADLF